MRNPSSSKVGLWRSPIKFRRCLGSSLLLESLSTAFLVRPPLVTYTGLTPPELSSPFFPPDLLPLSPLPNINLLICVCNCERSPNNFSSSMPVAPKPPKKTGAPKGKGAVRAKSGCYTCRSVSISSAGVLALTNHNVSHCRIRRKKCDEKPNEDGHCETCVRLRLECLGFGTKRPEWLRVGTTVLRLCYHG
jgi:hypothetical protein